MSQFPQVESRWLRPTISGKARFGGPFHFGKRLDGATPPRLDGYSRMLWTIIQINSRLRAVEPSI
jgi:hypothetical protein